MDSEQRQTLVALVRQVDELEKALKAANEKLDQFLVTAKQVEIVSQALNQSNNGSSPPNRELIDYVSAHRVVDYAEAARLVYGNDTKPSRDNVQAKMYYLAKQGWLRKLSGRNEWEVSAAKTES